MDEHIDPILEAIITEQQEKGGFSVSLLESGTKLSVETKNSIYQILMVGRKEIKIAGGMTPDGEMRYESPIEAVFVGSTYDGSTTIPDWIGRNMKMQIATNSGLLTTSVVFNVEIDGPNKRWSYGMEWKRLE